MAFRSTLMRRFIQRDMTESLSRLHLPGSMIYALRPKGWGKTTLLHDLSILLSGQQTLQSQTFPSNTWIRKHRNILFRQPKMIPILLSLSESSMLKESLLMQLERQLIPTTATKETNDNDANANEQEITQLVACLQNNNIIDAMKISSKLHHNRRIAILVDDFDDIFCRQINNNNKKENLKKKKTIDIEKTINLINQLCQCVEYKAGAGIILMKGTFRPLALAPTLKKMRDLTLDLHHNNTWGMTVPKDEKEKEKEKKQEKKNLLFKKGYVWNEKEMRPILYDPGTVDTAMETKEQLITVAKDDKCPYRLSGGYWFGGRNERNGLPESMFSLTPWSRFVYKNELNYLLFGDTKDTNDVTSGNVHQSNITSIINGIQSVVNGTYELTEMERWTKGMVNGRQIINAEINTDMIYMNNNNDGNKTTHTATCATSDWALVLFQAGLLTMASRSMRFDEFHTYAWIRTWFPNETARQHFIQYVLYPTILRCTNNNENTIVQIKQAAAKLSLALNTTTKKHDNDTGGNDSEGQDQEGNDQDGNDQDGNDQDGNDQDGVVEALKELTAIAREISTSVNMMTNKLNENQNNNANQITENDNTTGLFLRFLLLSVVDLHVEDYVGDSVAETDCASDTFTSNRETLLQSISPISISQGGNDIDLRWYRLDGRNAPPSNTEGSFVGDIGRRDQSGKNVTLFNRSGYPCVEIKL